MKCDYLIKNLLNGGYVSFKMANFKDSAFKGLLFARPFSTKIDAKNVMAFMLEENPNLTLTIEDQYTNGV